MVRDDDLIPGFNSRFLTHRGPQFQERWLLRFTLNITQKPHPLNWANEFRGYSSYTVSIEYVLKQEVVHDGHRWDSQGVKSCRTPPLESERKVSLGRAAADLLSVGNTHPTLFGVAKDDRLLIPIRHFMTIVISFRLISASIQ